MAHCFYGRELYTHNRTPNEVMQPRPPILAHIARGLRRWAVLPALFLTAFLATLERAHAALQFDVFMGYDGMVREAGWFPVAVEVHNDGPSFNAVVELSASGFGNEQLRRVPIELPTNTRKRFIIPVFGAGGRFYQWSARLLDERGKVQQIREGLQPKFLPWETYLLGAVPRTFAGVPTLADDRQTRPDLKPQVARMAPEQFPDNPIALEGLDALYLNSERALSLKTDQIAALLTWIHEGGRVVISVEQLADVNSTPWLQQLLPCDLTDVVNVTVDEDLLQWLRSEPGTPAPATAPDRKRRPNRPAPRPAATAPQAEAEPGMDASFIDAQISVATGKLRDGRVVLSARNTPLLIEARRGRGEVKLLTFSPEREPFRSWKSRGVFWSKILQVPATRADATGYGGWSLDGVFGALIDSRQVRKLPVEWLLLLLVVYLVVIGPFDQWWLKKINRQMLTWITFPTYVVLFSLLIYFIGYKLRAGETEWNELQVVDILPRGQRTGLRGHTFASVYSSANATYPLSFAPPSAEAADQSYACLRGELLDLNMGGKEANRANVEQRGNVFRAEIFVPVWTSLLYVNDWFQPGTAPLTAALSQANGQTQLVVENLLDRKLTDARVVYGGFVYELGILAAGEKKAFPLDPGAGLRLENWVGQHSSRFQTACQERRNPLGDGQSGHLDDLPLNSMVASFSGQFPRVDNQRTFVAPWGMDLSPLVEQGDAILMAWDANHAYTSPLNQFKPVRLQRNALLRLAVAGHASGSASK
jgi:hypothetical protein